MKRIFITLLLMLILILVIVIFTSYRWESKKEYLNVKVIEWHDDDVIKVSLVRIVDGDTVIVKFSNGSIERIRIIGYNAWELKEPLGLEAKYIVKKLLIGKEILLDIDNLESRDKYGRILGYLWFKINHAYCSLTKIMLIKYRKYVKNILYIKPDEHPYYVWIKRYIINLHEVLKVGKNVRFNVEIHNCTGKYIIKTSGKIILTGGVYLICIKDGKCFKINLIKTKT